MLAYRRRIVAVAGILLAPVAVALGQEPAAVTTGLGDDYFAAGAGVELDEPVSGDALLAGGSVDSNASIGGDATIAGGRVAVRATVGDDLYVAGGQVEVDALISGNARIAGGRIRIAPETRIEGGAAIAGGIVSVQGSYGRYLTVAGGEVTLGGEIAGDVHVYADELRVLSGTRIGGQLAYRTTGAVNLPPDVEIRGGVVHDGQGPSDAGSEVRSWSAGEAASGIAWVWLAGLFAVGLFLAFGLAQFSRLTTQALTGRPWIGMGVGFLVLACVPAVILALFVTLIGIPLALIVLLVYLAVLLAAYVVGALYLGDLALARARPGSAVTTGWRLGALLFVLIALALVQAIPVFGGLARFAVLLLGLGGIALATRQRLPRAGP